MDKESKEIMKDLILAVLVAGFGEWNSEDKNQFDYLSQKYYKNSQEEKNKYFVGMEDLNKDIGEKKS